MEEVTVRMLDYLTPKQRDVVILRLGQRNLTFSEIGEHLRIEEGAARRRYARAKIVIKIALDIQIP